MIGNHFLLIEAPHALPEDVVLLGEDAPSPDVHHGLGRGDFWTRGGAQLLRRPTVLQPGRNIETIHDAHQGHSTSGQQWCLPALGSWCNIRCKFTVFPHFFQHQQYNLGLKLLAATITYSDLLEFIFNRKKTNKVLFSQLSSVNIRSFGTTHVRIQTFKRRWC